MDSKLEILINCVKNSVETREEYERREKAVELLKTHASKLKEVLIREAERAQSLEVKTIFAEILIEAGHDERTFEILKELFLSGQSRPLYAQYLGKYGDERAAMILYPALDNADYADYLEIKNAIERLGGLVDEEYRDFSGDPVYKRIKGEKD